MGTRGREIIGMDVNELLTLLNSEHFVGGGTRLIGWVGAPVPTDEMRC